MASIYPRGCGSFGDPEFCVLREAERLAIGSNSAADTVKASYQAFCKMKLIAIVGRVGTAGSGATAGFTIKNGTTSIGVLTLGIGAAGTIVDVLIDEANQEFAKDEVVNLTNVTSDTAFVASELKFVWQRVYDLTEE